MKVLLLLVAQNPGGVEKRFYNYYKYVSTRQDAQYTIIISRSLMCSLGEFNVAYKNRIIKYGVNWNVKNIITRYIDYILLFPLIISLIFTCFDAVHYITNSGLFFKRFIRSKRNVYSIVTSIRKSQENLMVSESFKKIMNENYKIDCLDENIQNIIADYFPNKRSNIFVSPCSFIDYEEIEPKFDDKENIICFAGRLEDFKGIQLLVEIIPKMVMKTNYSIKIFGKGRYYNVISTIIEDYNLQNRVSLNYTVNLKKELLKSRIFLSLQKEENYPSQSLLEAMACGNAIIATNAGLTRLLVKDDFGMLINFDSNELLHAIIKMTSDDEILRLKAEKARNFVVSNHTVDRFHKYLFEIYKDNSFDGCSS